LQAAHLEREVVALLCWLLSHLWSASCGSACTIRSRAGPRRISSCSNCRRRRCAAWGLGGRLGGGRGADDGVGLSDHVPAGLGGQAAGAGIPFGERFIVKAVRRAAAAVGGARLIKLEADLRCTMADELHAAPCCLQLPVTTVSTVPPDAWRHTHDCQQHAPASLPIAWMGREEWSAAASLASSSRRCRRGRCHRQQRLPPANMKQCDSVDR